MSSLRKGRTNATTKAPVVLVADAMMIDKKTVQDVYIRICRDSGFSMDSVKAAVLTGIVVGCHPLEVWLAMPSLDVMNQIAAGNHPAVGDRP